ncbi:MAG: orotidine-5'-phosphate decarboxylase [Muribaculaceae bacterium]|nr:orotidine-5'-phosphate decarboxylase [Muribaculaceae bacterium]
MTRQELIDNIKRKKSYLCVGLDTDLNKIPKHIFEEAPEDPVFAFNKAIIDATAPYCVAYKPNIAFYETLGYQGWIALEKTIRYIRATYPDQFIIADAKRGDIGNTARMYARAFFDYMDVDALTVAPYMGEDSVTPFMEYPGKWTVLLALTSNKGSHDFQFVADAEGNRLFERVLAKAQKWGNKDNLMFVAGATQGSLLADVRQVAPDSFLLVPGVGAQGGSLEEVAKYAMNDDCGLLVNSSRGIIYASTGTDFDTVAAIEARNLAEQMAATLKERGVI